jgi:hypothetical protein
MNMKNNENIDPEMTYRQSESRRMQFFMAHPHAKNYRVHPRTHNWHACFGTHSAMGCDGCDFWAFCMDLPFLNGWRRDEKVKGEFFVGVVVLEEEH